MKRDIEDLDEYFDGYEIEAIILCPLCHSDDVKQMEVPTMDGHFETGWRSVWWCGECQTEFHEPLEE